MRRKYSDIEKAEALAAVKSNGGNIFRTSQELKIPWATLADWVKGTHGINESITELREEKEADLAALCESVARKYLNQAGNEYVVFATPGNLAMTAAGIAIDKSQLLRGKPTEIHAEVELKSLIANEIASLSGDPIEREAELQRLFANKTAPNYDPKLDVNQNPAIWPSGRSLIAPEATEAVN